MTHFLFFITLTTLKQQERDIFKAQILKDKEMDKY